MTDPGVTTQPSTNSATEATTDFAELRALWTDLPNGGRDWHGDDAVNRAAFALPNVLTEVARLQSLLAASLARPTGERSNDGEWEYGVRRRPSLPPTVVPNLASARSMTANDSEVVQRRKAGQWVPVADDLGGVPNA